MLGNTRLRTCQNDPDTYIKNTFFSGHHLIGGCAHLIDENFEVKDNLECSSVMQAFFWVRFKQYYAIYIIKLFLISF